MMESALHPRARYSIPWATLQRKVLSPCHSQTHIPQWYKCPKQFYSEGGSPSSTLAPSRFGLQGSNPPPIAPGGKLATMLLIKQRSDLRLSSQPVYLPKLGESTLGFWAQDLVQAPNEDPASPRGVKPHPEKLDTGGSETDL